MGLPRMETKLYQIYGTNNNIPGEAQNYTRLCNIRYAMPISLALYDSLNCWRVWFCALGMSVAILCEGPKMFLYRF